MYPIVDLHCDLLSFLAFDPKRSIEDPKSLTSYPQMRKGGVALQTLAIFTESRKDAFMQGQKQLSVLQKLLATQPNKYRIWNPSLLLPSEDKVVYVLPSFENADGFCQEGLPIQQCLSHLESIRECFSNILYISLTWNGENRFGGGCGTKKGLKEDGKELLKWMDGKQIAVDVSHASDYLADDIFNCIDKYSLHIPVIASHSNARAICPHERNLPDVLAKEIFARQGIVGLNLFAPFIGDSTQKLREHVDHFYALGGQKQLCFGADFFPIEDFETLRKKFQTNLFYFPSLSDASCYPAAMLLLDLPSSSAEDLCHKNFEAYITNTLQAN